MIKSTITICNKAGLHARAAAKMVGVTSTFISDITVGNDKMVDGKSILSLMMLAAGQGTVLNIHIDGVDEKDALDAVVELVNNRFDESQ
ncbi:MAG: HPr family phosphocarrier protein [Pseudohongiellaceae bacterium]|nr:HPr family phosphocarrier protein [Pseudohongiellaceae bacterium]